MKQTFKVILNQSSARDVVSVFKKYGNELPYEIYRKAEKDVDYQLQWSQPGEPTMLLTYRAGDGDNIDIHYEPVGYALLNKKSDFPFDWTVRLNNSGSDDLFDTVRLPDDYLSVKWLKTRNPNTLYGETNEMFIVFMFIVVKCCTTWFGFAFDKAFMKDGVIFTPKKDFKKIASDSWEDIKYNQHKEHLYDNVDTVTLDENQFVKMGEYVDEVGMNMNLETLPLENFAFRFVKEDGLAEAYFYTLFSDGLLIAVDSERKGAKRFSFAVILKEKIDPETGEKGLDSELKPDISCGDKEKEWMEEVLDSGITNWQWVVYSYFGINTFMLNYRDVSVDVREVECKQSQSVHKPGKVKERTVVKMFKRYTLKKDWKRAVARKKQEYHCLAWSVRGHFRTYRNGKKVFVRPYIKGKEKDKFIPKDYVPVPSDV